jgi:hypothetical protein
VARREVIDLVDDLDGTVAAETIPFAFEGKTYSVDLSAGNAERFRQFMEKYIVASKAAKRQVVTRSRKQPAEAPKAAKVTHRSRRADARAIRLWAQEKGIEVSPRGIIPREVREAYEKANRR